MFKDWGIIMTQISEVAFDLIIADGQLENAILEQRRWRLRRIEAEEKEQEAKQRLIKIQRTIDTLKRNLNNGYNRSGNLCY